MIYDHHKKSYGYILGKTLYFVAGGSASILGVFVTLPAESWPEKVKVHHQFLIDNAYNFFLTLSILLLMGAILLIRGDKRYINLLQFTVNRYQDSLFNIDYPSDAHYENRITLFKHKKCVFTSFWKYKKASGQWKLTNPFSRNNGWLCPVLRSHDNVPENVIFSIPRDTNDKTDGIASRAWVTRESTYAINLPNIESKPSESETSEYSKKSLTTNNFVERYLAQDKSLPRSIAAMPVESKGQLWGVLVIDTLKANRLDKQCFDKHPTAVSLINRLVEDSRL